MLEDVRTYNEETSLKDGTLEQERNEKGDCGFINDRLMEQQNETSPTETAIEPAERIIVEDIVGSEGEERNDHVQETFVVQQQKLILRKAL